MIHPENLLAVLQRELTRFKSATATVKLCALLRAAGGDPRDRRSAEVFYYRLREARVVADLEGRYWALKGRRGGRLVFRRKT